MKPPRLPARFAGLPIEGDMIKAKQTGFTKCQIEGGWATCSKGAFSMLGFSARSAEVRLGDIAESKFTPDTATYEGVTVELATKAAQSGLLAKLSRSGWVSDLHRGTETFYGKGSAVSISRRYLNDDADTEIVINPIAIEDSNDRVEAAAAQARQQKSEADFIHNMSR